MKRLKLSLFFLLAMLISSSSVLADELNVGSGSISIDGNNRNYTQGSLQNVLPDEIVVTGTNTSAGETVLTINGGTSETPLVVTLKDLKVLTNVSHCNGIRIVSGSYVILNVIGNCSVTGGRDAAGLYVMENSSMILRGDENSHITCKGGLEGDGTASGGGPGIGGDIDYGYGNITIESGNVEAIGVKGGAGIGSGWSSAVREYIYGKITISGGNVKATGSTGSLGNSVTDGIGAINTTPVKVVISGGNIDATVKEDSKITDGNGSKYEKRQYNGLTPNSVVRVMYLNAYRDITVDGNGVLSTIVSDAITEDELFDGKKLVQICVNGTEGGTVTAGGVFDPNVDVNLTATAADGFKISSWSDDENCTDANRTIKADDHKKITVNFASLNKLSVTFKANGNGKISLDGGETWVTQFTGDYDYLDEVTVIARANDVFTSLSRWNSDWGNKDLERTFTIRSAGDNTAYFSSLVGFTVLDEQDKTCYMSSFNCMELRKLVLPSKCLINDVEYTVTQIGSGSQKSDEMIFMEPYGVSITLPTTINKVSTYAFERFNGKLIFTGQTAPELLGGQSLSTMVYVPTGTYTAYTEKGFTNVIEMPEELDVANGEISIDGTNKKYTQNNIEKQFTSRLLICGSITESSNAITISGGTQDSPVEIVLRDLNIEDAKNAILIKEGAHVKLTIEGVNTVRSGKDAAGIKVEQYSTLEINAENTEQKLYSYGGSPYDGNGGGAGIGANPGCGYGNITINNGTIYAEGCKGGAGIGSGWEWSTENRTQGVITINGGNVTAVGSEGIGGFSCREGIGSVNVTSNVKITGGTLNASVKEGTTITNSNDASITVRVIDGLTPGHQYWAKQYGSDNSVFNTVGEDGKAYLYAPEEYTNDQILSGKKIICVYCNSNEFGQVSGGGIYNVNDKVILSATGNNGYVVKNWSDNEKITSAKRTITVTEDAIYTANFEDISYRFPSIVAVANNGSISHYATFSNTYSDVKLLAEEGKELKVYNATVSNGQLILEERPDNMVAKGEGVLVYTNGETVTEEMLQGDDELIPVAYSKNNLVASGAETSTVEADEGYKLFRLTFDNVSERAGLGFYLSIYQGADNGKKLEINPNKAYLLISESSLVSNVSLRGFAIDDNETTAIYELPNDKVTNVQVGKSYNLNGQRVGNATNGLIVRDGKKIIVNNQ